MSYISAYESLNVLLYKTASLLYFYSQNGKQNINKINLYLLGTYLLSGNAYTIMIIFYYNCMFAQICSMFLLFDYMTSVLVL
jgi:hypothetical protein